MSSRHGTRYSPLSADQRKRFRRDLSAELRRSEESLAAVIRFRAAGDHDAERQAMAAAEDAAQHAASLRSVLSRFAAPGAERRAGHRRKGTV